MKKILAVLSVLIISLGFVWAQTSNGPEIKFDKMVHDFGKVKLNSKAEYKFNFTNIGNKPLVITNIEVGCSCTTPVWPKTAIMPGKKDGVIVGYLTDRIGPIDRTITVKSNTGKNVQIKIIGEVVE